MPRYGCIVGICVWLVLLVTGVLLYNQQRASAPVTGAASVSASAPSVVVTPEAPQAPAPSAPVTATPPSWPQAPAVTVAPSAPVFEANPLTAEAPSLPGGWSETPSQQETPTIEVTNEVADGERTVILFALSEQIYQMDCSGSSAAIQLPAGEYSYQLRSTRYNRLGIPDQTGRFRCRRYRLYNLIIGSGNDRPDVPVDVGDH